MVRNVIFDLGGVVLDWNPDRIVAGIVPETGLQSAYRQSLFGHADWGEFDRGTVTEAELIERLALRLGRSPQDWKATLDAIRNSLVVKTDTVELIRALRRRGISLYCLSNMPVDVYTHLKIQHTFWDAFSGIVISGEVKMMKPEPEVFLHLLATFGIRAEDCVFIDDLAANVEAARQTGMQAILFKDARQCEQELATLLYGLRS
jgi:putative hydrolase of the HAD superfamily